MRSDCSLLKAEGHANAWHYPIILVWEEAELCRQRLNHKIASESMLMQMCIGSVLNGKKGAKEYQKYIKELTANG